MSQYVLQSIGGSLSLIELLYDHEELSPADMMSMTDYGKNSIFRMLNVLEKHKMVTKAENGRYRLGYRPVTADSIVTSRTEATRVAHPYLMDLSTRTKGTIHLAILVDDTKAQFLDEIRGDSSTWMESSVGMARKTHLTGTGKTQSAFCDEVQTENYIRNIEFSQMTRYTIKDEKELRKELDRIRRQGYACDKEEGEEGLVCFAAPVVNSKGKVVAVVSISGFRNKMHARQDELIREIREIARQIPAELV